MFYHLTIRKPLATGIYRFLVLALLVLLISHPLSAAERGETKRVLILYSEDKDHPAHAMTEAGIREGFLSNGRFDVQLYSEYLDMSRFGNSSHARAMADLLRHKYAGMEISIVITVYPCALDFLLEERSTLFPEAAVIAAVIIGSYAERLQNSSTRRFVTGTVAGGNIASLMDGALQLRPETRHIALVGGTTANDMYHEEVCRVGLRSYDGKMDLIDLTRLSMEETLVRVGSLPPDTVVLFSCMLRDGSGRNYVPREALSLIARASNAPVFALDEPLLGSGIVGGRLVSLKEHGREAAAMALRIMGGESAGAIPFGGEHAYVTAYDWRELRRWGISEQALPPGSRVDFKSLSMWEEHQVKILVGLIFVALETLLIIGLFVNLRKRKQAEIEIGASELRYRTVAEYTYDWEYWVAPDGTFNYVSPSCERITGYSVCEFTDDPSLLLRIILPEEREIWKGHDHEVRNQLKPGEIQFRIRKKGGEIRWIDHTCLPLNDVQGKFLGIRASNRDITDRKKAEFEAQQHWNELARVTRVAAMGELTSSLAHELNQPLAAISNYASAAQRFLSQSEPNLTKVREALEGIVWDNKRAAEVVKSIRGLLKKEEPYRTPLRMNKVIQEMLAFIRSDSVVEGLSVETELTPRLPVVLGNPVQLQQVLLNLILNALEATSKAKPDLRKLVIKTEHEKEGAVRVSVKDFGVGIEESHMEKLFEPFHTTKPGGLGMGLAISARIIHAHGGTIWGENNPGRGATFYFTLPTKAVSKGPHLA